MNTTQTRPTHAAGPFRPLSPLARAILADWDDPGLSELALAARHGLTIEALHAQARSPAFRAALAAWRALREDRLPYLAARSEALAARVLTALASREADSQAAAKEVRLATKDLLRLLAPFPNASPAGRAAGEVPERSEGGGGSPDSPSPTPQARHDPDPASTDPRRADLQSASLAQPEPPKTPASPLQSADTPSLTLRAREDPDPAPAEPQRGGVGAAAPTRQITIETTPELPTHLTDNASLLRADWGEDAPRSEDRDPRRPPPTKPPCKPKYSRG